MLYFKIDISSQTEIESQSKLEDKIFNMLYDATKESAIRFSRPLVYNIIILCNSLRSKLINI